MLHIQKYVLPSFDGFYGPPVYLPTFQNIIGMSRRREVVIIGDAAEWIMLHSFAFPDVASGIGDCLADFWTEWEGFLAKALALMILRWLYLFLFQLSTYWAGVLLILIAARLAISTLPLTSASHISPINKVGKDLKCSFVQLRKFSAHTSLICTSSPSLSRCTAFLTYDIFFCFVLEKR